MRVMSSTARTTRMLLTVADVAALPADLPSGRVRYELDNGKVTPPGYIHGDAESNLITELKIQGERRGYGKAISGDVGIILWRDPDHLVGADAVFIAKKSLPVKLSREGYLLTIPDLVVEVVSKKDTPAEIDEKVKDCLKSGVHFVWIPDPTKKTIVHRKGRKTRILHAGDALTIEEVIPGFTLPVKNAFEA